MPSPQIKLMRVMGAGKSRGWRSYHAPGTCGRRRQIPRCAAGGGGDPSAPPVSTAHVLSIFSSVRDRKEEIHVLTAVFVRDFSTRTTGVQGISPAAMEVRTVTHGGQIRERGIGDAWGARPWPRDRSTTSPADPGGRSRLFPAHRSSCAVHASDDGSGGHPSPALWSSTAGRGLRRVLPTRRVVVDRGACLARTIASWSPGRWPESSRGGTEGTRMR